MSVQERVRYHQYMRPRYENPTYASTFVGATLNMPTNPIIISNSSISRNKSLPTLFNDKKEKQLVKGCQKQKQRSSQLSSYGSNSLTNLKGRNMIQNFSEQDIYQKQIKKYNIISMNPINHKETIKKYPKYRLQDLDINYFKKQQLQKQYETKFQTQNKSNAINPQNK